jgi:CheY-like chemotaxis protein
MSPQCGGGDASGTHASQAALVLVVEDYEDTRALLAWFLREAGFRVETAGDGVDGIQKAVALKPDLIVMDLGLPAVDGLEASRRLKRDERKTSTVWSGGWSGGGRAMAATNGGGDLKSKMAAAWASWELERTRQARRVADGAVGPAPGLDRGSGGRRASDPHGAVGPERTLAPLRRAVSRRPRERG